MCGIAGLLDLSGRRAPEHSQDIVRKMLGAIQHRGPDDSGLWTSPDGRCVLGHRRLSIIDLSAAGHQPMTAGGSSYALTFNGEIYNYQELRDELSEKGDVFSGQSDTEVLLTGLVRHGLDFVKKTDGMFAFALYNSIKKELVLARDFFGEKPLYYTFFDGFFAFCSELHAFEHLPNFKPLISRQTIAQFLQFQYVPAPSTFYEGCRKLPPAHSMTVSADGQSVLSRYYAFVAGDRVQDDRSLDDRADELEELLLRSLKRRLISDVPLGAFLSGGVDSSTVVALITRRLGRPIKTFSMGFVDAADSEHQEARAIAEHLGSEHHERLLPLPAPEEIARIAANLDEPNADSSCLPTFLLSQFARTHVTVALSGDGGDEMFGGYQRYFDCIDASEQNRERIAAGSWHIGQDYYAGRLLIFPDRDLRALLGDDPDPVSPYVWDLRHQIDVDKRPLLSVLREQDANNYMPGAVLAKVDRMSMRHGLEVRTPFLSPEVGRFAQSLPMQSLAEGRIGKLVLRHLGARYLPQEWLMRPKKGFGLPVAGWGERGLRPHIESLLLKDDCRLSAWIPPERLRSYWEKHSERVSFYQLWSLAILEHWLRLHDGKPV